MTGAVQSMLIDKFNDELANWDYDSWMSASASDKESIVVDVISSDPTVDIEEAYDLFWEWADGLEAEDFN